MLFEISLVFFTMSLVLFAISSVFFSIPSVVFPISPMLPIIATLAFAESGWTTIQWEVGSWMGSLRTLFVLNSRLIGVSHSHRDLLQHQII